MKLSDFVLLSEEEKKWAILHRAVLVSKRSEDVCKFFLFQLDDYYVEMICQWQTKEVEEFRIFLNTDALAPYLATISLDGLFEPQ